MLPNPYYSRLEEGQIDVVEIAEDIQKELILLPYDHELYFKEDPSSTTLSLSQLVCSRARNCGIVNASKLMQKAAACTHEKRLPISVKKVDENRFLITDGNSTAINAIFSNWPDLPCIILE